MQTAWSFARRIAGTRRTSADPRTTSSGRARDAETPSGPGGSAASGFAVDRVRTVEGRWTGGPVYNLTVADAHEYVAGGLLVHNCDAAYWSWHDLRKGGTATIKGPPGSVPTRTAHRVVARATPSQGLGGVQRPGARIGRVTRSR
jgi:hypothetical protein